MEDKVSGTDLPIEYLDLEARVLSKTESQKNPKAILLGGQPGSGKSYMVKRAKLDLDQGGGVIVIDADQLREKNPQYKRLSKTNPQHAADLTHKEAAAWARRLTQVAAHNRRNLVIDGTMRDPDGVWSLIHKLREHGYSVEARVIAVKPEISMARARLRFEEQVARRGTGRFVNQAQHDVAYKGLAMSVRILETGRIIDVIRIYDAHRRELYANQLVRGEWEKESRAEKVLVGERERSWTASEHEDYVKALENISQLAKKREQQGRITLGDLSSLETSLREARQIAGRIDERHQHQVPDDPVRADEYAALRSGPVTDMTREAEAQRLGDSAAVRHTEQQAMLEASPVEKTWQEALASYVQLKQEQVARIEDRLEKMMAEKQQDLAQSAQKKPGLLASVSTRRGWQSSQVQQKSRIQNLQKRLEVVREIRWGMGVFAPRIEELATRKMRAAHPEMASDWDAMREVFRSSKVRDRLQAKVKRKVTAREHGHCQRISRH